MNTTANRRIFAGTPLLAVELPSAMSDIRTVGVMSIGPAGPEANEVAQLSQLPAASRYETLWQVETQGVQSMPAIVDGTVFAGSLDGFLRAVDTETGKVHWQFDVGGPVTSPIVHDDIVFVSGGGRLYAIDTEDGCEAWSATIEGDSLFSDAVIDNGTLYVGGHDGYLYAIHPSTGEVFWHFQTQGRVWTAPTVAGGIVFVRSDDGNLYALDTFTGEELWHHSIGWTYEASAPVVANGVAYASGTSGTMFALDAETGSVRWQVQTAGIITSTPLIVDRYVCVSTELTRRVGTVCALDLETGSPCWQTEISAGIASPLGISGDTIYLGDAAGTVHGLDGCSGAREWSLTLGAGLAASAPVVTEGMLFLGTSDCNPRSPLPRMSDRRGTTPRSNHPGMNPN